MVHPLFCPLGPSAEQIRDETIRWPDRHFTNDPGAILPDDFDCQRLSDTLVCFGRPDDIDFDPERIDPAGGLLKFIQALFRQFDQHRADIFSAEPRKMALQPVAACRIYRIGYRASEAGAVAADHRQDYRSIHDPPLSSALSRNH